MGFRGNANGLTGPGVFECHNCEPSTYFFAHFVTEPNPTVQCYAISRESYKEWDLVDAFPATQELMYLLRTPEGRSLNPRWRPPR